MNKTPNMNRQERRRQERSVKKKEMQVEIIQPWSVPVMKTTLTPKVLQTMIEISDLIVTNKEPKYSVESTFGPLRLLPIDLNILEQTGVMDFFMDAVRYFIIQCKCQTMPFEVNEVQQENWLTEMVQMWAVSQLPGEYLPMHTHWPQSQISAVMYLKVPKVLPSRKEHKQDNDGSILFVSNASRDIELSQPSISIPPKVGDFYIFGAHQQHEVYPFRCEEGQEDTERRSISFNAFFQPKTAPTYQAKSASFERTRT